MAEHSVTAPKVAVDQYDEDVILTITFPDEHEAERFFDFLAAKVKSGTLDLRSLAGGDPS